MIFDFPVLSPIFCLSFQKFQFTAISYFLHIQFPEFFAIIHFLNFLQLVLPIFRQNFNIFPVWTSDFHIFPISRIFLNLPSFTVQHFSLSKISPFLHIQFPESSTISRLFHNFTYFWQLSVIPNFQM